MIGMEGDVIGMEGSVTGGCVCDRCDGSVTGVEGSVADVEGSVIGGWVCDRNKGVSNRWGGVSDRCGRD